MGQYETAKQVWDYLTKNGWLKTAVAAVLGNMQSESGIIADRWESDRVGNMSGGYGLVQWTPATKYINWAQSNGLDYKNVISQCKRIEWEVANSQQFFCPFMTFKQFTTSAKSPEELANIFIQYYERPAISNQPARAQQARYWYEQFESKSAVPRIKVLDWFNKHRGHITYSMDGSRIGTDGTADCSGSIT
ncbi:phage tail tip lysozyme [Enterococcus villorum]|uniref:phage tail tip lysozyme n=1 Tax=Enterococcus villorum TaxID=112904 RepID=UPI001F4D3A07|nr:phage tail tip lysozyme [Enterococcus villorum]